MNEQQQDFDGDDPDDWPFHTLYELARHWAGDDPRVLDSLTRIIGGYEGLHELVGQDRAGELFARLAKLLHARAPSGKQVDYERDAELLRLDREVPKGKKQTALHAMAEQRGVEFDTLNRRLKELRRVARKRRNAEESREQMWRQAVAAYFERNPS